MKGTEGLRWRLEIAPVSITHDIYGKVWRVRLSAAHKMVAPSHAPIARITLIYHNLSGTISTHSR
jgi:hypothetical protein